MLACLLACRQEIVMPLRSDTVENMEANVQTIAAWIRTKGG